MARRGGMSGRVGRGRASGVSTWRRPPQAGAPLLSPADTNPLNAYDAARPEWFLVGVYEFSHLFPGEWAIIPIFIVPGLLVCVVLAMPFVGKHPIGQGFNVLFTVLLLAAIVGLTYYSYAKDRADPVHQKAIAVERCRPSAWANDSAQRWHSPGRGAQLAANRRESRGPAIVRAAVLQLPQPRLAR